MKTTVRKSLQVGETVTLELPYSEVCMHLGLAGEHRPVHALAGGAQILNPDLTPFSFPVTWGEAGIFTDAEGPYAEADLTVRDLPNVRLVKASDIWGNVPEAPSEGDVRWAYGSWEEGFTTSAEATHAILGLTVWSDYSGSTVERSNERALLEAYPDTFIRLYGDYGTSGLMIPVDRPVTYDTDTWGYLLEELAHLADYPLYSDEDLSALELELAEEAWDLYLGSDVRAELAKAGVPEEALEDEAKIRERFYALTYAADYGPEAESADSVVFPFMSQTIATIAAELGAQS